MLHRLLPFHNTLATEYRMVRRKLMTPPRLFGPSTYVPPPPPKRDPIPVPIDDRYSARHVPRAESWHKPFISEIAESPPEAVILAIGFLSQIDRVTARWVLRAFSRVTRYRKADYIGPSRRRPLVTYRQFAMATTKLLVPSTSLPAIGRLYGDRDHTTVLHALNKYRRTVAALIEENRR